MTRRQSRAEATYPSTQALADLLTASTGGWLPEEAAIGLLAAHDYWLHRSGFRTACITLEDADPDAGLPEAAWITWETVLAPGPRHGRVLTCHRREARTPYRRRETTR